MNYKNIYHEISESERRQNIENSKISAEQDRKLDTLFKGRVNNFCLETNNQQVIEAYNRMINPKKTDIFYSKF